jgi:hypothetical protein
MNKIKKFFNSLEESFVFPVSRRTWQIMSLLAIVLLVFSIIYFTINSTPTKRDDVVVSKEEVTQNKVDTTVRSKTKVDVCSKLDLLSYTDSLRRISPKNEWINLGDSSEPMTEYFIDEYGNYVIDENNNYVTIKKRFFEANENAVPNMIEIIYSQRGLDTSEICSRLDVLKTLYILSQNTTSEYLQSSALMLYTRLLSQRNSVNEALVKRAFIFRGKIEGVSGKISDNNILEQFLYYLEYLSVNDIDDEKISIATELVSSHKKMTNKSKLTSAEYFNLAEIVFEANLSNEDLSQAIPEFQEELAFYDKNGLSKSLTRYLRIYQEKVAIAESDKQNREIEKSINKTKSINYAMYAFISIVGIATVLLLFSIQSILKNKYQDNKD